MSDKKKPKAYEEIKDSIRVNKELTDEEESAIAEQAKKEIVESE